LIVEEYFNDGHADSLHQLQSATKSIVSTYMGIAIQEKMIKGVHELVLSYFADKDIQNIDPRKEAMTIEDLLTQRHRMDWHESPWNSP
jgi:CubicO group peptidase (beta-lactamase class C family)